MKYAPVIGLEIHIELATKTKMFCACLNDPDEANPNKNICPVCMAHPGTLPVINKEAVKKVLKTGLALNGEIAEYSEFSRKNYFYPDLPKGYQISQYELPVVRGGSLSLVLEDGEKTVRLTRADQRERVTAQPGDGAVTAPTALLKVGHSYWVELVADKGNTLVALGEVRHVSGKGAGLKMTVRLPV